MRGNEPWPLIPLPLPLPPYLDPPPQLRFRDPVLRDFPAVDHQHGNFQTVAREEIGIRRDIHVLQHNIGTQKSALNDGLHLIAQVTAGFAVNRQAQLLAISSAAPRGSAAATIGRPTTR